MQPGYENQNYEKQNMVNPYEQQPSKFNGPPNYYRGGGKTPTVANWLLWLILLSIPFVNFIMIIVWAVDSNEEYPSRKTFARAAIIFALIMIAITIIFSIIVALISGVGLLSILSEPSSYYY